MQVVIRTDSSFQIGTGHVMRCLTLAQQLQAQGAEVTFVCRDLPGNIFSVIQDKGFKLIKLAYRKDIQQELNSFPEHQQWLGEHLLIEIKNVFGILQAKKSIDLLVVDHYALDESWETAMRSLVKKIMVIDDLADRKHDCDVLLDHNFYLNLENRYNGLLPVGCKKLLGPTHALLNPMLDAVRDYRKQYKVQDNSVIKNVLIFMGGADPKSYTLNIVRHLLKEPHVYYFNVVVGNANQDKEIIKQLCEQNNNLTYHEQSDYYYQLLKEADLAIGAGGVSLLERCYIQLKSIVIIIAMNQKNFVAAMSSSCFIILINSIKEIDLNIINKIKVMDMNLERLNIKKLINYMYLVKT